MAETTRTAKEQLEEWDKILDEYESSIGLAKYQSDLFPESESNIS